MSTEVSELPPSVALGRPDLALFGTAARLSRAATDLVIDSPPLLLAAAEDLKQIKAIGTRLEDDRKALKAPVLEAGRRIDALYAEPIAFCATAERVTKGAINAFRAKIEREEAEARAAADRAAREERERLAAESRAHAAAGRTEEAEAVASVADLIVAPVVPKSAVKVAGIVPVKRWTAEIVDAAALLRHVADHPELHGWITFNSAAIVGFGRATQGAAVVPGVAFKQLSDVSVRG